MDKYYLPRTLDVPFRIYILTIDELSVLVLPVLVSLFIDQIIAGTLLSAVSLSLLKHFKNTYGHHFIKQFSYWYLPEIVKLKATPPSYIRKYIG